MSGVLARILAVMFAGTAIAACVGVGTPASHAPAQTSQVSDASPSAASLNLPTAADGLPVLSVIDAVAAHDAGAFGKDSLVAVGGWLELTLGQSCPMDPSNPNPAPLERVCGWMDHILAKEPQELATNIVQGSSSGTYGKEPTGPYLAPRQGEGAIINQAVFDHQPAIGSQYAPRAAVIVGLFHDPRAVACPAAQRATCDGEFVADQVAWLDGEMLGATFWIGGDATGQGLHPRLDLKGVQAAVGPSSLRARPSSGCPQ